MIHENQKHILERIAECAATSQNLSALVPIKSEADVRKLSRSELETFYVASMEIQALVDQLMQNGTLSEKAR